MTVSEEFEWVALPAGRAVVDGEDMLRVSIFVAPKVTSTDEPERELTVGELPILRDWPHHLATVGLSLEIDGVIDPVAVRVVGRTPDSNLWRRLIPSDLRVLPFVQEDPATYTVLGYNAATVADVLVDVFASAGAVEFENPEPWREDYWLPDRWAPVEELEPDVLPELAGTPWENYSVEPEIPPIEDPGAVGFFPEGHDEDPIVGPAQGERTVVDRSHIIDEPFERSDAENPLDDPPQDAISLAVARLCETAHPAEASVPRAKVDEVALGAIDSRAPVRAGLAQNISADGVGRVVSVSEVVVAVNRGELVAQPELLAVAKRSAGEVSVVDPVIELMRFADCMALSVSRFAGQGGLADGLEG